MDITAYLRPLIKWWWLLVSATLLAAITSFIATLRQPLMYQSQTTLMIGRALTQPNPNSGDFYLEQQLASLYADIGNRELVRNGTTQALGINWLPSYSVRALPNTQLIEIDVNDSIPLRAQAVANELAHQLILQSPSSIQPEDQSRHNFINDQLNTLQQQIKDSQEQIQKLNLQVGSLNSASQIADMQSQINTLESKVTTLQNTYASLAATSGQDATNSLTVIEPANLPTYPTGPNKMIVVLLASVIGLVLACLGVYAIELLDDSIKSADEISHILNVPIVGHIPSFRENESHWDYIYKNPRSPIADAFRMMRTNIEFLGVDHPIKSILMTSPNISEGKSTIASNLAFSFAQIEKKVIIVDADFRRPVLHTAANVPNDKGLSNIFLGTLHLKDALTPWFDGFVRLLPAGELPLNPTELMGSQKMVNLQNELKKMADVIIIDAPPLILADSLILSKKVDGVLLVIRLGRTRKSSVLAVKKQIEQTETKILGIVVNQSSQGDSYYYNHYYPSNDTGEKGKSLLSGLVSNFQANSKKRWSNPHSDTSHLDSTPTPPFIESNNHAEVEFADFSEINSLLIDSSDVPSSQEDGN